MDLKEAKKITVKSRIVGDARLKQFLIFAVFALLIVSVIYIFAFNKLNLPRVANIFIFLGMFIVLFCIYHFCIILPLEKKQFEIRQMRLQEREEIAKKELEKSEFENADAKAQTKIEPKIKKKSKKKKKKK